jgi:hypothetical protein
MEPANTPLLLALERLAGNTVGDRWKLERFLASGGMSAVYAGHHRLLKTKAAGVPSSCPTIARLSEQFPSSPEAARYRDVFLAQCQGR